MILYRQSTILFLSDYLQYVSLLLRGSNTGKEHHAENATPIGR